MEWIRTADQLPSEEFFTNADKPRRLTLTPKMSVLVICNDKTYPELWRDNKYTKLTFQNTVLCWCVVDTPAYVQKEFEARKSA